MTEEVPLIKSRLESEERNIKELQARTSELSKKVSFHLLFLLL